MAQKSPAASLLAPPAICLMGPTAAGKTDLAIELCEHLPCEIISVDSALVYRGLDVGSAKPDAKTLKAYPHHLVDIRDPADPYSAANFREDALVLMADITDRGKIPLLVGGTMLYFRSLIQGMAALPEADPLIRAEIEAQAQEKGWGSIHQELSGVDPATASRLKSSDRQRLQRALEVFRITGVPMSQLHREQVLDSPPYRFLQMAMTPSDRKVLHQRIEDRFRQMVEHPEGIIQEVQKLRQRGDLHVDLPAIRSVGYRQVWEYLDGEYDHETMIHKGIVATRQLAKRQLTWLRRWNGLYWIFTDRQNGVSEADGETRVEKMTTEALNFLSVVTTK